MISQMVAFVFSRGPAPSSSYGQQGRAWKYIRCEEGIMVGEIFVKNGHEWSEIVFEEFRDVLAIEINV